MQFDNSFERPNCDGANIQLFDECGRSPSQRSIKSEDDSPERRQKISPKKRRIKFVNETTNNVTTSSQAELEKDYRNNEFEA